MEEANRTVFGATFLSQKGVSTDNSYDSRRTVLEPSFLQTRQETPVTAPDERKMPPVRPQSLQRGKHNRRNVFLAILILLLITGGAFSLIFVLNKNNGTGVSAATGQVTFLDNQNGASGNTDALNITVQGLNAPPAGSQYDAWLVNDQSEQILPLGTLTGNGQQFSVRFTGSAGSRQQHTNLLGAGNKIEITQEQGQVNLPTGKVVLEGIFPPKAFVHIRHLLFSFPTTPGTIGLLVGLRSQTRLLNGQALILQNVAASHDATAIACAAQSIIDISEGVNGPHYAPLAAGCTSHNITEIGDSFGLLGQGYIALAAEHASLAANQSDTTANIRTHAGLVEIATSNIKGWVTTVDADAVKLLANPSDTSVVPEIVNLSDHAYHGVDANGNGQVDPVAGEAGAITGYVQGQLMATLPLLPGA